MRAQHLASPVLPANRASLMWKCRLLAYWYFWISFQGFKHVWVCLWPKRRFICLRPHCSFQSLWSHGSRPLWVIVFLFFHARTYAEGSGGGLCTVVYSSTLQGFLVQCQTWNCRKLTLGQPCTIGLSFDCHWCSASLSCNFLSQQTLPMQRTRWMASGTTLMTAVYRWLQKTK